MTSFPENLPRWNQRQKKRQRLQRVSGVVLLAASAGGAAFWGNRLWPARGTGWVVCVLLAAVPLALWLLLDCPPRREQRPEELAVFNMDKATPGSVVLLAVTLFFWLYLPEGMIRTENGSLQLEGWLAESLLGFVFMGLAVYMLVAFRNEVLFVAPDGSVECWNVLGQHRLVEERAAMVRIRPLLGRSYVCDAAGNVLYHFDRGMINTEPLLDWLQSQGVANTGTEMRRQIANPWPRVLSVLDWDEADRTPVHRIMPWLRLVAWLPPVMCLIQWWLLVRGMAVMGLQPASLLACWLPLAFFGLYFAWPQIFVWNQYPEKPRRRALRQILATPAWRRMHVSLGWTFLPVLGALLWAVLESMVFLVSHPWRLAALCVVLGVLLAVLCEKRRPRALHREWRTTLVLAVLLAFPMGYSLNLALTRPAFPDQGTVLEVRAPEAENYATDVRFLWEGQELSASLYQDPAVLPRPGEEIDLCVRESLLGIPLVSVCSD